MKYCKDCKYSRLDEYNDYNCNKVSNFVDTPCRRINIYYDKEEQNENNDCEFYEGYYEGYTWIVVLIIIFTIAILIGVSI